MLTHGGVKGILLLLELASIYFQSRVHKLYNRLIISYISFNNLILNLLIKRVIILWLSVLHSLTTWKDTEELGNPAGTLLMSLTLTKVEKSLISLNSSLMLITSLKLLMKLSLGSTKTRDIPTVISEKLLCHMVGLATLNLMIYQLLWDFWSIMLEMFISLYMPLLESIRTILLVIVVETVFQFQWNLLLITSTKSGILLFMNSQDMKLYLIPLLGGLQMVILPQDWCLLTQSMLGKQTILTHIIGLPKASKSLQALFIMVLSQMKL